MTVTSGDRELDWCYAQLVQGDWCRCLAGTPALAAGVPVADAVNDADADAGNDEYWALTGNCYCPLLVV